MKSTGLNDIAIIARNLHPGIWDDDGVAYCREVADQRCEARGEARKVIRERKEWARNIIRAHRESERKHPKPTEPQRKMLLDLINHGDATVSLVGRARSSAAMRIKSLERRGWIDAKTGAITDLGRAEVL
jgi:hypothetical protein